MCLTLIFTHLKTWGIKSGLSVLDQGLYSGANFILNVMLARWLLPSQYGVFSIVFAVYLFAYQIHNSILIEPMSVLGPSRMRHRLPDYIREQISLHFVLSILAGFVIVLIGSVVMLFDLVMGKVIILMGVALSFMLLPLLMRRVFYIFQKPIFALLGSTVYALVLFGGILLTDTYTKISVNYAFPIIGLAGLAAGYYLLKQIPSKKVYTLPISVTWRSNWDYGKWLVVSSLLIALAGQVHTFVVGGLLGLSDAGAFRALQNFIQPVILFFTAVCGFFLPSLSNDFGTGNMRRLKRKGKYLIVLFLVVSLFFELALFIYGESIEAIVYNKKFSSYAYLIPVWGLAPMAAALTYVFYFLLQSIQRPKAILIGSAVWSLTSAIFSVVLSKEWGIEGATISVVLGYLFSGLAFAVLYLNYISSPTIRGAVNEKVIDKQGDREDK